MAKARSPAPRSRGAERYKFGFETLVRVEGNIITDDPLGMAGAGIEFHSSSEDEPGRAHVTLDLEITEGPEDTFVASVNGERIGFVWHDPWYGWLFKRAYEEKQNVEAGWQGGMRRRTMIGAIFEGMGTLLADLPEDTDHGESR